MSSDCTNCHLGMSPHWIFSFKSLMPCNALRVATKIIWSIVWYLGDLNVPFRFLYWGSISEQLTRIVEMFLSWKLIQVVTILLQSLVRSQYFCRSSISYPQLYSCFLVPCQKIELKYDAAFPKCSLYLELFVTSGRRPKFRLRRWQSGEADLHFDCKGAEFTSGDFLKIRLCFHFSRC